jgi:hypothetical protein
MVATIHIRTTEMKTFLLIPECFKDVLKINYLSDEMYLLSYFSSLTPSHLEVAWGE